jgi:hypothetical protein
MHAGSGPYTGARPSIRRVSLLFHAGRGRPAQRELLDGSVLQNDTIVGVLTTMPTQFPPTFTYDLDAGGAGGDATPEPTSLALLGLGLAMAAVSPVRGFRRI